MWGVPIDHEYFSKTNIAQWLWYYYNYLKDQEDNFTRDRSLLEYHVSFLEPELVNKIVKDRNIDGESDEPVIGTTDDAAFNVSIGRLFGRNPNLGESKETYEIHEVSDMLDRISEYEQTVEAQKDAPLYNYRYWAEFDLEK